MLESEEGLAEAPTETTSAPESYVSEDGTFKEGWRNSLDEDVRADKSLESFKSLKDLAKSFVATKKMVGKDRVAVPTDKSSEAEWGEFYKAAGRPETVADYGLKITNDVPKEIADLVLPKDRLEKWQERFYKNGISKKAANQLLNEFVGDVMTDIHNDGLAKEQQMVELKDGLYKEWGSAYDQKVHLGNVAIEVGVKGDEDFKAAVIEEVNKNPILIKLMANIGGEFAEHKSPNFANIPTPSDIDMKINEEMAKPAYMNRDDPGHKNAVNLVHTLFVKRNESKTKSGIS